jgi:hypothetical protein
MLCLLYCGFTAALPALLRMIYLLCFIAALLACFAEAHAVPSLVQ